MATDELRAIKVTLRGPIPNGGSYTTTLLDPKIDRLISRGWTISRAWQVWQKPDGSFYSKEV